MAISALRKEQERGRRLPGAEEECCVCVPSKIEKASLERKHLSREPELVRVHPVDVWGKSSKWEELQMQRPWDRSGLRGQCG